MSSNRNDGVAWGVAVGVMEVAIGVAVNVAVWVGVAISVAVRMEALVVVPAGINATAGALHAERNRLPR